MRYYKEANILAQITLRENKAGFYFKGLTEAYKKKGNYANALQITDSAYGSEVNNLKRIKAVKFAEMHEEYETGKKDLNIVELSGRNKLNEKIIRQQRWTFALALLVFPGALSFFNFLHRQYRRKEQNRLLESENRRLNMEQKLLQAQINPPFIFNSIANLRA